MPRMAAKQFAGKPMVERARGLRREQTPQEEALWKALRGHSFHGYQFRRQHQLGRYIADFYCAKLKLVIELDGAHHQDLAQKSYDKDRDLDIAKLGLKVLRFQNQVAVPDILAALATELPRAMP
jgi:very-short-patch-repair endonuclease